MTHASTMPVDGETVHPGTVVSPAVQSPSARTGDSNEKLGMWMEAACVQNGNAAAVIRVRHANAKWFRQGDDVGFINSQIFRAQ